MTNKLIHIGSHPATDHLPRPPRITTADGVDIPGVMSCRLTIEPAAPVVAELSIFVGDIDVEAVPLLSLATVEATAQHYGYRLVPLEDAE